MYVYMHTYIRKINSTANKGLLLVAFSPHLQVVLSLTQDCLFSSSGHGCLDGSQRGELL